MSQIERFKDKKNKIREIHKEKEKQEAELRAKENQVESLLLNVALFKRILKLYESEWEETTPTFPSIPAFRETWNSISGNPIDDKTIHLIASNYTSQSRELQGDFTDLTVVADNNWNSGKARIECELEQFGGWNLGDPNHFAKSNGKYEIEGTDNKIYRLYSKNEVSIVDNRSPQNIFVHEARAEFTTYGSLTAHLSPLSFNITVVPELQLITIGSLTATVTNSLSGTGVPPGASWAFCEVQLGVTVLDSSLNPYFVNYYTKATNADDNKPSGAFEVDWTNMTRNFYDDLESFLASEHTLDIEDDTYKVVDIQIRYNNRTRIFDQPPIAPHLTCDSTLDFRLDEIKFVTAQEGYIIFEYDLLSDTLVLTENLVPFVEETVLTKSPDEFEIIIPEEDGRRELAFVKVGDTNYKVRVKGRMFIRTTDPDSITYPQVKLIVTFLSPHHFRHLTRIL